jgi:PAS domain-containing protein
VASEGARHRAQAVHHPLAVVDGTLRVRRVNRAFCERFGTSPAEAEKRLLSELPNGPWHARGLRELLDQALHGGREVEDVVEDEVAGPRRWRLRVTAHRVDPAAGSEPLVLIAIEEQSPEGAG